MKTIDELKHAEAKFWARVDKRSEAECWPWLGCIKRTGYGQFCVDKFTNLPAHRFSLILKTGFRPDTNTFALHACDNPRCVNPAHLSWGSNSDNIKQAYERNGAYSQAARKHMANVGKTYRSACKLTPEQIEEVKSLRLSGELQGDVASKFGVTRATVYNIERGITYGGKGKVEGVRAINRLAPAYPKQPRL